MRYLVYSLLCVFFVCHFSSIKAQRKSLREVDDPKKEKEPGKRAVRAFDQTNTPKFEFINYTDFKGYDQDQPNGIAQSQFLFKWPISSRLFTPFNTVNEEGEKVKDERYGFVFFRDFIFPNFLFNRIDKNNDFVPYQPLYDTIKRSGSPDSIILSKLLSSFDVIKYTTFVLNGKIVPITIHFPRARLAIDLTGSIYKLKVQDSANLTRSFSPIYSFSTGWNVYYDTKYSEKEFPFNLRLLFGGERLRVMDNFFTQVDGASLTPDGSKKVAFLINQFNKRSSPIWRLSVSLKKNLGFQKAANTFSEDNNEETSDNYLFFRFNYSWQKFNGNVAIPNRPGQFETKSFYNHFSQFQLGIDLNFDSFFTGKGSKQNKSGKEKPKPTEGNDNTEI